MILGFAVAVALIAVFLLSLYALKQEFIIALLMAGFAALALGLAFYKFIFWAAVIGLFFLALIIGLYFIHSVAGD